MVDKSSPEFFFSLSLSWDILVLIRTIRVCFFVEIIISEQFNSVKLKLLGLIILPNNFHECVDWLLIQLLAILREQEDSQECWNIIATINQ